MYKVLHIVSGDFLQRYTYVSSFLQEMSDAIFTTRASAGQAIKQYRLHGWLRQKEKYVFSLYILSSDTHRPDSQLSFTYMGNQLKVIYLNKEFSVKKAVLQNITKAHPKLTTFEREVWCKRHKIKIPSKQEFIIVEI